MAETIFCGPNSPEILSGEFDFSSASNDTDNRLTLYGHTLASAEQVTDLEQGIDKNSARVLELPGSYAAVIRRPDSLELVTDDAGQFPLYYYNDGRVLKFSSSASSLAENGAGITPDRHVFGGLVLGERALIGAGTAYANITCVLPGSTLRASSRGVEIFERAPLTPDVPSTYDEAVEQLRHALTEAVSLRAAMSKHLGSDFSGGLDSTSLAFLAANSVPHGETFDAFHYEHQGVISGDKEYAAHFAALDPRIRLHYMSVPADVVGYNHLDLGSELKTDLPIFFVHLLKRLAIEGRTVADAGVTDHMLGEGGDALFTPSSLYIADLIRKAPIRQARRILQGVLDRAQLALVSPWKELQSFRLHAGRSIADSYLAMANKLSGQPDINQAWHGLSNSAVNLLREDLRNDWAELAREQASRAQDSVAASMDLADYVMMHEVRGSAAMAADRREIGRRFGLNIHAPYLDRSVIAACLQTAAHLRTRPYEFKSMLRDAMQGLVPDAIFARRTKGVFSEEEYRGVIENAAKLRLLLGGNSLLAQLNVIDPKAMQEILTKAELGLFAPLHTIAHVTSAELWLRAVHGYDALTDIPAVPPQQLARPLIPVEPPLSLHAPRRVPEHTRLMEDDAAVVSYNFVTRQALTMSLKARTIIKALQQTGDIRQALNAFQELYPSVEPRLLVADFAGIIHKFEEHGTLEPGEHRNFAIRRAALSNISSVGEVVVVRGELDKSGVTLAHYVRMGRALISAIRLTRPKDYSLYDVIKMLQAQKEGLPYSTSERVERLLTAGHALNRYIGQAACVQLTTAVILAEARQGRRVDFAAGFGPLPRQFHAWPVIDGVPVQTAYDEVVTGKHTAFDVW